MIPMKVRISDTVMGKDDWDTWELTWGYSDEFESPIVVSQRVLQIGPYGQDFTSWDPAQLSNWSSYDGTGTHPECFHEIYDEEINEWRSFLQPNEIIRLIDRYRHKEAKFILWDPADGQVPLDDEGRINTSGILGRLTTNNIYLQGYAQYPDHRRPESLEVNEAIHNVVFALSGECGAYSVIRVV